MLTIFYCRYTYTLTLKSFSYIFVRENFPRKHSPKTRLYTKRIIVKLIVQNNYLNNSATHHWKMATGSYFLRGIYLVSIVFSQLVALKLTPLNISKNVNKLYIVPNIIESHSYFISIVCEQKKKWNGVFNEERARGLV